MAGIYIHIPFCKQACHYCNFHFSTHRGLQETMLEAIAQELKMQRDYMQGERVDSIYLGGGTPSLLEVAALDKLLVQVAQLFVLADDVEVTLEANPDDLHLVKLKELKVVGINRLSIGIQTFQDGLLRYLHRIHDSQQAIASVQGARKAGFDNLTIDLIYGIPTQGQAMWEADLTRALSLQPAHIAAYCLTIEPKTVFGHWQRKGKLTPVAEEVAARQFESLVETLEVNGYEHYEISNFSRPHHYARHNTNYWKQGSYLGVGPGAHSYNGQTRQCNVRHNQQYINGIQQGVIPCTVEVLHNKDHINEYIMTRLRTKWGCDLAWLKTQYGYDLQQEQRVRIDQFTAQQLVRLESSRLFLTKKGKLLADEITAALFVV
ncbi:MAG: radical SAM family heme chaperone HemW [Cytophagales bacterium]|nr:radical SAM family heme chaperone HemW [Cytophagales bacterium]